MANAEFEVLPSPIKSESDKKEYRVIKLKNELVACLISDVSQNVKNNEINGDNVIGIEEENKGEEKSNDDEKKAAAMLSIGVGSFSDPKEIQGLSHFLEHMVFMGSEKFPTENDFITFILKRGGSYNAFTMEERTAFFFDCLEKHLREALDKFAQFFIAPLLKHNALAREREAVDSEYQLSSMVDYARKQQILQSLAKEDSPFNSFTVGNLKTLKENIDDEKLYEVIHAYRKRHYSSNRMTLAIQSRLSLDSLENLVLEFFSEIPNNCLPKDDFSPFIDDVFNIADFNKIYYIKPIDNVITLDVNWSLPPLLEKYKSKTLYYISFILQYEGKGSLTSYLKKRIWATSVYVYNSDTSINSLLSITVILTEEGYKHIFNIIDAIFAYIKLMKKEGPQQRIYEDIKIINDNDFRFASEKPAVSTVLSLEGSMDIYPPEHFLTGSMLIYEFDPTEIEMVIDILVPKKVNIMILNKTLPEDLEFNKTEKWYGAEYTDVNIPDDLLDRWENVQPYPEFEIPTQNPYLTTDFTILPELPNHLEYPQLLITTDKYELWYRQDQKFKLPLAYYNFYIISPVFMETAKQVIMTDFFIHLLTFCFDEEAYPAKQATLDYNISSEERGISVKFNGYNEKLPLLVDLILKYMINLSDYINEEMFNGLKQNKIKDFYNGLLYLRTLDYDMREKLLIGNKWTYLEQYNELLDLTYEDMEQFIDEYRNSLYVKALIQGNMLPEVAINLTIKFVKTLNYEPLPKEQYPVFEVTELPIGEKCLYIESFNKSDCNSIVDNYYQVGPHTLKDSVILDILVLLMDVPVFDTLRTKEQLAYAVSIYQYELSGILGYTITVNNQAHKFTTEYVDERIDAFITQSKQILEEITIEDFQHVKEDYIKTKKCVDVELQEEFYFNWNEIMNDDYMFDRKKQEIETAKDITLDEVKEWWVKHNHFGEKEKYRKLSIQIAGHIQEKDNSSKASEETDKLYGKPISLIYLGENKEDKPDYFIENIDEFRDTLPKYPPKPIKMGP